MAYIKTGVNEPGIVGLLFYKGSTGKALSSLAHTLLHGPSGLSKGERETIAAYVSKLNECNFCCDSHAAAANVHLNSDGKLLSEIFKDIHSAPISEKLKSLLLIAGKVQKSGREVKKADVEYAKANGASDEDIHDTVLIASAFCMYNRYVDGLCTAEATKEDYTQMGKRLAKSGYKYPPQFLRKLIIWYMNHSKKE